MTLSNNFYIFEKNWSTKMIPFNELLNELGYDVSPYYRPVDAPLEPETAYVFRGTHEVNVKGIYFIKTSPDNGQKLLPARPVVFLAEADTEKKARQIHRSIWNLSYIPFLIIQLPHQIRIYTGFNYSEDSDDGLLDQADHLNQLHNILINFTADSIDSKRIWNSKYAKKLDPEQRVDKRLLKNLEQLGQALKNDGLRDEVAHALIGKYVYFSYLRDRDVLTDDWLIQQEIDKNAVFELNATISSLKKLDKVLEDRVNGKIFPIDYDKENTLKDKHVSWVASVFKGDKILATAPELVQQLHLPFKAYDFRYIPVETFSAIYEQFISKRKEKGAIYTPEILADYLISEMESIKPLQRSMKILDPACGSGLFLVLVYRRLIEKEINRSGKNLKPEDLCEILLESIYGVERERDACYVTEFSLILTLLNYLEHRDLKDLKFRFPGLHNKQIFECDFFDKEGEKSEVNFWDQRLKFDWIVGNPPWIKANSKNEKYVLNWINTPENNHERPVGNKSVAEAFSWAVTDLLKSKGTAGLILPATSLFNLKSKKYRQTFFTKHQVFRITNFANFRNVLFDRRATLPAATIVFRPAIDTNDMPSIIHYGPYSINQISKTNKKLWSIIINESEIQTVSPYEAAKGETSFWKFALWGNYLDRRVIERLKHEFPVTLKEICKKRNWHFRQSAQLRNVNNNSIDNLEYIKNLKDVKIFKTDLIRQSPFRFSIPRSVLQQIPDEMCYIRKRGGKAGLKVNYAPHIILSPVWMSYIIYSDQDFIISPKHIGISASVQDLHYLRAISIYLRSNLVAYYLFFNAHEWGIFRQANWVSVNEVGEIPVPELSLEQIEELAKFQIEIVKLENKEILNFFSKLHKRKFHFEDSYHEMEIPGISFITDLTEAEQAGAEQFLFGLRSKLQRKIDKKIFNLFKIPEDIRVLVDEFVQTRLLLDRPSAVQTIIRKPTRQELLAYAKRLRDELDDFVMGSVYHRANITFSNELIECKIEITKENAKIPINENSIKEGDLTTAKLFSELNEDLREQFSQWVYVQQGLRLFEGSRIHIYKAPRLIDWTRTQAMIDAADIIGQAIEQARDINEND